MVWMPKILKEEIKDRIIARGEELGVPGFYDMIADENRWNDGRRDPSLPPGKRPSGSFYAFPYRIGM